MKQVKVTINGDILVVHYCSSTLIENLVNEGLEDDEEDAFNFNFNTACAWNTVDGLYIDDGDENVVKSKGKYVKTKEYWHNLLGDGSYHSVPVEVHWRVFHPEHFDYIIELEDDEEFDIKKVQLIKSEYEHSLFPYFIRADVILYDGKEVKTAEDWETDYNVEERIFNRGEITELYD